MLGYVWAVWFVNGESVALANSHSAFEGQMLTIFESVRRLFSDLVEQFIKRED